jgi:LPXTG-motif cell wall-anchored protein
VNIGGSVNYTLVVTNTGNAPLYDVVVTDKYFVAPYVANVTDVQVFGVPATINEEGSVYAIGELLPGESVTLTYTYRHTAPGTQVNEANVTAYTEIGDVVEHSDEVPVVVEIPPTPTPTPPVTDPGPGDGETPEVFTTLDNPTIPAGYTLVQAPGEPDVFIVYNEDNTPLGAVVVPEGESIEDIVFEDNFIPLGLPTVANPQTGDTMNPLWGLLSSLIALGAYLVVMAVRKRKTA